MTSGAPIGDGTVPILDVFVSYEPADERWASWIAWQLEEFGYRVFLRAWDVVPADHWVRAIDEAIRRSRLTVAVVSEAYHRSPLAGVEWQAAFAGLSAGGEPPRLLPVRVQNLPVAGLLASEDAVDLFDVDAPEAVARLVDAVQRAVPPGRPGPAGVALPPGARRPAGAVAYPGRAWLGNLPVVEPLSAPYLVTDEAEAPLAALRARNGIVPFQSRDELAALLEWCTQQPTNTSRPRLRVVTGPGGSGKTHLLAELTARLTADGWYAGFLRDGLSQDSLDWLATLTGPVAVVVDYAEAARVPEIVAAVRVLALRRVGPTCVILGARTVSGWWDEDLKPALRRHDVRADELPVRHPSASRVFRRACSAFAAAAGRPGPTDGLTLAPATGEWTTLDLVMLAWLDVHQPGGQPTTGADLYEELLGHEFGYWTDAYVARFGERAPTRAVLRAAGAAVTLLAPQGRDRVDAALDQIDVLRRDDRLRAEVTETLLRILPADPADGSVALRPDPVGDHLVITAYQHDPAALVARLTTADELERLHACVALTRAAATTTGPDVVANLATQAVDQVPGLWTQALTIARAQGGPLLDALVGLARRPDTPLPLQQLATDLPASHATLRPFAAAVTARLVPDRSVPPPDEDDAAAAERASLLRKHAVRLADEARYPEALAASREAVASYRRLTEANPAAFRSELASALSNLAGHEHEAGERAEAATTAAEAVALHRALAEDCAETTQRGLAGALNNQALLLADVGEREAAFTAAQEAAALLRDPAAVGTEPSVDLAIALDTLALQRAAMGQREAALAASQEAVDLCWQLTETEPAMYLPRLVAMLHTLVRLLVETGDRERALVVARSGVDLSRRLNDAHPVAFRAALARSLDALASALLETGDRAQALTTAREAVVLRRPSADAAPTTLPDPGLAIALSNLAGYLSRAGQRAKALAVGHEAVAIRRQLSDANPRAYEPDLATSLSNFTFQLVQAGEADEALPIAHEAVERSRRLAEAGQGLLPDDLGSALLNLSIAAAVSGGRAEALAAARESSDIFGALAESSPAAFLPGFARSLHSLASRLAENGDHAQAVVEAQKATAIRRQLAQAQPAAFLPDLAESLTDLATRLSETGDRAQAAAVAHDATTIWRRLAERDPAAFLPDLAGSLQNLANRLVETGQQNEAHAAAGEAVDHYRRLAEACPAAFEHFLAGALNTLVVTLGSAGVQPGAVAVAGEATEILRRLAGVKPDLHTPDLASALNNLAQALTSAGEPAQALQVAQEAVDISRILVDTSRAAWLPKLAGTLTNLGALQMGTRDPAEARAAARESVDLYRELVETRPRSFLPELAAALNNLAHVSQTASDLPGAIGAAREAVEAYKQLSEANPALYLHHLAVSLTNLANALAVQDADEARSLFESELILAAGSPATSSYVLIAQASWRATCGDTPGALDDLALAARQIDDSLASDTVPPALARRYLRETTRSIAHTTSEIADALAERLPAWAGLTLYDDTVAAVRAWTQATTWDQREAFLTRSISRLADPDTSAELSVLALLNPDVQPIYNLVAILAEIAADGLDTVMERYRETAAFLQLLTGWLSTRTWTQSRDYLTAHPDVATDPRTRAALEANAAQNPTAARYLAILNLLANRPAADVYDVLLDPAVALDEALDAVTAGDGTTLGNLRAVAPILTQAPFVGSFLVGVQALLARDTERAVEATTTAVTQATNLQLAAASARLRRLRRTQPDLMTTIDRLITILKPADLA